MKVRHLRLLGYTLERSPIEVRWFVWRHARCEDGSVECVPIGHSRFRWWARLRWARVLALPLASDEDETDEPRIKRNFDRLVERNTSDVESSSGAPRESWESIAQKLAIVLRSERDEFGEYPSSDVRDVLAEFDRFVIASHDDKTDTACGSRLSYPADTVICTQPKGHDGPHSNDVWAWDSPDAPRWQDRKWDDPPPRQVDDDAPASRSRLKREAAQKGEPMPTFNASEEGPDSDYIHSLDDASTKRCLHHEVRSVAPEGGGIAWACMNCMEPFAPSSDSATDEAQS